MGESAPRGTGPGAARGLSPARVEAVSRSRQEGVCWSAGTRDLDVNLVAWNPRHGVAAHVNAACDVLLICVRGRGEVEVDGVSEPLAPNRVVLLPRGARRSVRARTRLVYLTAHRRRPRSFSWEELLGRPAPATR